MVEHFQHWHAGRNGRFTVVAGWLKRRWGSIRQTVQL
jgi:hypothetical protein